MRFDEYHGESMYAETDSDLLRRMTEAGILEEDESGRKVVKVQSKKGDFFFKASLYPFILASLSEET